MVDAYNCRMDWLRRSLIAGLVGALLAGCSGGSSGTILTCQRWERLKDHLAAGAPLAGVHNDIDDMEDTAATSGSGELKGLVDDLRHEAALLDPSDPSPSQGFLDAGRAVESYCESRSPGA
jgi:hypothetical protein